MKSCDNSDCEKEYDIKELLKKIPTDEEIYQDIELIKALADPTRLKILYLLLNVDEMCVCQIMEGIDKSQPTISHHLNILKKAELLKWSKKGIWVYYSLSTPKINKALKILSNQK